MKLVLGGPGCGKTTYLLQVVEQELDSGVLPQEIAFVAFTRKAAREARERAMQKFGLVEDDIPYFRTLHSLAFRQLGLSPNEIMGGDDYKNIGSALNLSFGAATTDDEEELTFNNSDNKGDQIAYLEQISRLMLEPLQTTCEKFKTQRYWDVKLYRDTLQAYKKSRKVLDFTDILEMYAASNDSPAFKVVIVDEAQDLSAMQWQVVKMITRDADRVYVAGDDDQAIYEWSGADVPQFLNLKGEIHVLPLSHRLPQNVFDKAHTILKRIGKRYPKKWSPAGPGGIVEHYSNVENADFSQGSWFLLARNRYMLPPIMQVLRHQGYPYLYHNKSSVAGESVRAITSWESLRRGGQVSGSAVKKLFTKLRAEGVTSKAFSGIEQEDFQYEELVARYGLKVPKDEDWMTAVKLSDRDREYIRAVRRRGESLVKPPRLTVSTIHQVKGGEADHVLLLSDISWACYQSLNNNADAESRVFYVGATRAKQGLHIVWPRSNKFYDI